MESITVKKYLEASKQHIDDFIKNYTESSKPMALFTAIWGRENDPESYSFSKNNWNDKDPLRDYIYSNMEMTGKDFMEIEKEDTHIYFFFCIDDDERLATIVVKKECCHHTYNISWYKHRGKTDLITEDGSPISLYSYVSLLNLLGVEL